MRFFYLILILPLLSMASSDWKEKAQALLPAKMKSFRVGQTTISEAEKKLGKPDLVEGEKRYWKQDGFKYAIELHFRGKVLSSLHYTFTGKRPGLDQLQGSMTVEDLKGDPASHYLILKEKTAEIVVDPATKTLVSVRLQ